MFMVHTGRSEGVARRFFIDDIAKLIKGSITLAAGAAGANVKLFQVQLCLA